MTAIVVKDLVKEFRQYRRFSGFFGSIKSLVTREHTVLRAVDNVSFKIEKGEAVGYLGPNGAGKSTMIKMLTGILVPTSGHVRLMNTIPHKSRRENANKIGVVFGQRSQLWWDLPVMDSFELHKYVYKIPGSKFKDNLNFCVDMLRIADFINKPVRQLSLGQRMRVEIAMALLHDPEILFLDEPTIGLDVMAKDSIREFLRTVNREKKVTIMLTTHDLKDIEEICPRMVIVNNGHLVYDGAVTNLKSQLGNQRKITVEFKSNPGQINLPGTHLVFDEGRRKQFSFDRGTASVFDLLATLSNQYTVEDVSLEDADIEEVIRTLYKQLEDPLNTANNLQNVTKSLSEQVAVR
ncbi:ABC transporter ATP-binding protein [Lederbergia citrea]|uniref:ATP-binding cassette domain-containing protein n=1 Tax=Lederbergia citrea TaxID=2833581 RepID=A0A942URT8_9BACI|nr:ATP-binding cassette domain-containing protein [Lederbergia citrea]MBS4203544.1 ATP-binding cassette domain-containing protein [Lederbergia citrea]MBS4221799.1 ATP-binding cassette domain-containing protein [Lederbergia citrea]